MADLPPYPGMPRWVKLSGSLVIGLLVLVGIMILTGVGGPHGPGRHAPSGDPAGHASPEGGQR
jgi:hypothetical protein